MEFTTTLFWIVGVAGIVGCIGGSILLRTLKKGSGGGTSVPGNPLQAQ